MKHTSTLLFAAATAGATLAAAAESPVVVKILIPMVDQQSIDASVISAGPTATSYFLACPSGSPSDECGLASGISVLYGPSTLEYAMSFTTEVDGATESYSATVNCKLNPANQKADCTGALDENGTSSTLSETIPNYSSYVMPITVTAGADKLSGKGGDVDGSKTSAALPTKSVPPVTEGPGAATTLSTATVPTGSASGTAAGTGAAGSSSSSSTGAGARATQAAAVVVAAAVAVVGAVVM